MDYCATGAVLIEDVLRELESSRRSGLAQSESADLQASIKRFNAHAAECDTCNPVSLLSEDSDFNA